METNDTDTRPKQYQSFDDWYQEIENFGLRAERMSSDPNELRAAFDAGRREPVVDIAYGIFWKRSDGETPAACKVIEDRCHFSIGDAVLRADKWSKVSGKQVEIRELRIIVGDVVKDDLSIQDETIQDNCVVCDGERRLRVTTWGRDVAGNPIPNHG